ncbi:MAG: cobalamin biosynthesis protein [Rhodobacteraceae bacterium]|nr:cobalamin biosynthesis protein [Paracoccaceae bacterium]
MRVAGFGFQSGATDDSLRDALRLAGGQADRLATLADKAGAPAIKALASDLGLPLAEVSRSALQGVATLTRSPRIEGQFGTGSVAEAVALVAAGPGARLLGPRAVSSDGLATAAIAEGNGT